jgi:alternate F1F0 ATPase F1 subunit epsilon
MDILNLKIFSPHKVILDMQIKKVNFEDNFGNITILPKHQDYISSFKTNLISYTDLEDDVDYAILSDGVLVKSGRDITFSVYSAIIGETLEELKKKISGIKKAEFSIKTDKEKRIEENLENLEKYFFKEEF